MAEPRPGAGQRPYPEELRGKIDSGRTGDKVNFPDPAAAPLGTDDEAAGTPPPPAAVRQAIDTETSPETAGQPPGDRTREPAPAQGLKRGALEGARAGAIIAVLIAAIVIAALWFFIAAR